MLEKIVFLFAESNFCDTFQGLFFHLSQFHRLVARSTNEKHKNIFTMRKPVIPLQCKKEKTFNELK